MLCRGVAAKSAVSLHVGASSRSIAPAPRRLAWGCAFGFVRALASRWLCEGRRNPPSGGDLPLEDGEEPREAPRNGIDLDINPGRLPPPPEPRGRAAPSPRSRWARARRPADPAGPGGQVEDSTEPLTASPAVTWSAASTPDGRHKQRFIEANRSPSQVGRAAHTALPPRRRGALAARVFWKQPNHLCRTRPGPGLGSSGPQGPCHTPQQPQPAEKPNGRLSILQLARVTFPYTFGSEKIKILKSGI